ncbi:MAG: AAA family ATPase, partial [Rhizobium sp.]|nr:AAA family ATPase [Rhizobium sp.]
MLVQLSIRDIVLIERLDLAFEAGLSVLTGETGAGKSILLDSLSLALGGRGDGSLVRHGEDKGQVTAVFDVAMGHAARVLLRGNGVDDDGDLIFRRVQSADGRTRAYINDQPVSVQLMRQAGQLLVEIHGQHDDRALVDTDAHRMLLDAFAGLSDEAVSLGESYRRWRDADRVLKAHRARVEAAAREADYLRASVEELEKLSPRDGEEDELAERRAVMQKSERIAGDIAEASEFLNGHASPVPLIASLVRRLERKSHEAPG